jgi:NAD(P)-dependent dehydrogenase (short-subunit alcohol dehydrogenase family)
MLAQGGGSIINTSSTAAHRFHAILSAYQTSKAAIEAITRVVAASYGKQGIRCNAIAPGLTTSSNVEQLITEDRKAIDRDFSLTPDIAEPEDQAAAVVFLASDESKRTTGHTIFVDGGITVQMPYVPIIRELENAGLNRTDGG